MPQSRWIWRPQPVVPIPAVILGPGADRMQRGALLGTVVRAAQSFPVHRQYTITAFGKLPHKADEPLLESGGGKHTQQSGTCSAPVWPPQNIAPKAITRMSCRGGNGGVRCWRGGIQGTEQIGELGQGGVTSTSTSLHARRCWPLSYRTPQFSICDSLDAGSQFAGCHTIAG